MRSQDLDGRFASGRSLWRRGVGFAKRVLMENKQVSMKERLHAAAQVVAERRAGWHQQVAEDPTFQAKGGKIYPYDILGANLAPMFTLFEKSGVIDLFDGGEVSTVCDIGCANGDLSLGYALAGYKTTAVDFSFKHDQAPAAVARISQVSGIPLAVADKSVDTHFTMDDLRRALVHDSQGCFPEDDRFDVVVCFGLLYHLRNPYAFVESLRGVAKYVALGTHLFTHLPDLRFRVDHEPLAYMLDDRELNNDPTNYWCLSETAFHRLVRRCGFEILATHKASNNPLALSVPDKTELDLRGFVMLKAL